MADDQAPEVEPHDETIRTPDPGAIEAAEGTRAAELARIHHGEIGQVADGVLEFDPQTMLGTRQATSHLLRDRWIVKRYLYAVHVGATKEDAAAACGITSTTVREWQRRAETTPPGEVNEYTEFFTLVNSERAARPIRNLTRLDHQSARGSVRATQLLLDRDGYTTTHDRGMRDIGKAAEGVKEAVRSWVDIVRDYHEQHADEGGTDGSDTERE